jgi:hypothetical protein
MKTLREYEINKSCAASRRAAAAFVSAVKSSYWQSASAACGVSRSEGSKAIPSA